MTLISGPSAEIVCDKEHITRIDVKSAEQMCQACQEAWKESDLAILCAAVADFAPEAADTKIKKQPSQTELLLPLYTTPDIARTLGETRRANQRLVGFALETDNETTNALKKLESKHLDAIVLNSLRDEGAGFGTDTNCVTIFHADGSQTELPLQSKEEIAKGIVDAIC